MKAKTLAIGCVVLSMLVPAAAFSRGGGMGGMHHSGFGDRRRIRH
jgi:hypothetical protein